MALLLAALTPILLAPVLLTSGCSGCTDSSRSSAPGHANDLRTIQQRKEDLLAYAVENLNRLEQFDTGDMFQDVSERLRAKLTAPQPPAGHTGDPLLETWPQPEMLRQIVTRLNQWVRLQAPPPDWKLDPLVASLPEPLQQLPQVQDLGELEFSYYDGFALRETVWLRDVSRWACNDELGELDRARELFDWTVRNIQLEADTPQRIPLVPWETLLFGSGTAIERAWVFVLLARQQGLEATVLALADAEQPAAEQPRPWAVAALSEGELYLFDPVLGLPIPAPDGIRLDASGQLDIQPATLAQVAKDDALLRQLDVEKIGPYPVKSSDLKRVVALVEASPVYLACRMKLLESRLTGQQKMVLTAPPTPLVNRLKATGQVADARLWTLPFETLKRRSQLDRQQVQRRLVALLPFYSGPAAPLRKGRLLHLKGELTGPQGATQYYQHARPSGRQLAQYESQVASQVYKLLSQSNPKLPQWQTEAFATTEARQRSSLLLRAKLDASYWLGLIAFQRANYSSATDYFVRRTLEALPDGPWTHGAKYNLARTYEASGEREKAVLLYQSDPTSPAHRGDLLRAAWLEAQQPGHQPKVGRPPAEPQAEHAEPNVPVSEPEAKPPQPQP